MTDDLSGFQTIVSGLTPLGLEAATHSPISFALAKSEHEIAALLVAHAADPALACAISTLVAQRMALLHDIAARLAAVEDVGLRLIGERDAEQMIALFLEAATRIMKADHLAVCLLDAKSHKTCHLTAHGFDPSFLAPHAVVRERLPGSLLNAANAMFVGKDIPWRKEFLDLTRTYYGSSIFTVDYAKPESARQSINGWVEGQTRKRITNIIQPGSLNAESKIVLVNAIYFKGQWDKPFKKQLLLKIRIRILR